MRYLLTAICKQFLQLPLSLINLIAMTNKNNSNHTFTENNQQPQPKQQTHNPFFHKITQNSRFLSKFKLNQYQLRNKFKSYVTKERQRFPLAYQFQRQGYFDEINQQQFTNIRDIRQQKNNYMQELKKSTNEKNYHAYLKQSHQKTFTILEKKMVKVESIRKLHKEEVKKISVDLKAIDQSIRQQKLRSKSLIQSSRVNIIKSRKQSIRKKFSLADEERELRSVFHDRISKEKIQNYQEKQHMYHTVKKLSQNVVININKFIQKNQNEAQQIRFQRLLREFAQKQEIKIKANLLRQESESQVFQLKNQIVVLEDKIKDYREKLGERRYDSSIKFSRVNPKYKNRSFTQSREKSTHSEFFTGLRHKNHTEESFYD